MSSKCHQMTDRYHARGGGLGGLDAQDPREHSEEYIDAGRITIVDGWYRYSGGSRMRKNSGDTEAKVDAHYRVPLALPRIHVYHFVAKSQGNAVSTEALHGLVLMRKGLTAQARSVTLGNALGMRNAPSRTEGPLRKQCISRAAAWNSETKPVEWRDVGSRVASTLAVKVLEDVVAEAHPRYVGKRQDCLGNSGVINEPQAEAVFTSIEESDQLNTFATNCEHADSGNA
ncbi:hypothetical protein C8R43DRAFT_942600 [Mycena crocata]|nr:hypothetical protein C8R43DRAFT_942600 [Mycena crocata]